MEAAEAALRSLSDERRREATLAARENQRLRVEVERVQEAAARDRTALAEAVGGTTYYTYELINTQTKFANRRLIKLAIAGGELIGIDARCNEAQWGEAESKLKPLVGSFRLGAEAAPAP